LETGLDAVCLAAEGVGLLEILKEDSRLLECDAVLLDSSTRRMYSSWIAMIVPNNWELLAQ
jgi:hypothetical protein